MVDRTVSVRLRAEVGQYQAAMLSAGRTTQQFGSSAELAARKNHEGFATVGRTAAIAGGAIALGLGVAVKTGADFRQQMSGVAAVSNASATEMDALSKAALAAGADVRLAGVSASGAAEAEAELVKAGVSVADVLGGALTGSLTLATAGQLDQAEAATIAAQAMNVFKLGGEDVTHIADVLAAGANKSAADVSDLGEAMRQGGLVAAQTGVSLEETVGTLAAFSDRALVGSDAGTSLKTMLQRLNPQSEKAATLMTDLGFSAYDANGAFIGMEGLAGELQSSLKGMSTEQRSAALNTLFGSDAIRGANVLFELGEEGVREYTEAVDDQGAAMRMSAMQVDNLKGDWEAFTGALETAMITGTESTEGLLRNVVGSAATVVNKFNELPPAAQSVAVGVAGISSAALLAGGGMLMLLPRVAKTREAMESLGMSGTRVKGMLGTLGKTVGAVGLLYGVATAAQAADAAMDEWLGQGPGDIDKLGTALINLGMDTQVTGELSRAFGDDLSGIGDLMNGLVASNRFEAIRNGFERIIGGTKGTQEELGRLDAAFANLVSGGNADVAADAFDQLAKQAEAAGYKTDDLRKLLPQYATAQDAAAASAKLAAKETESLVGMTIKERDAALKASGATSVFAESVVKAEPKVRDLTEAQKRLGEMMGAFSDPMTVYTDLLERKKTKEQKSAQATADATKKGTDSWEDYADDVDVSLGQYAKALERQNRNARDWRDNLVKVAERAGADVALQLADMGTEGVDLVAKMANGTDSEMKRLGKALKEEAQLGGQGAANNLDAAMKVMAEVARMGGKATVKGLAEELGLGTGVVARITSKYGIKLAKGVNPVLRGVGETPIDTGSMRLMAAGGYVSGPGGPRDDKIPARLSDGEYVINARSTADNLPLLEAINAGRYAEGGLVALGQKIERMGYDVWQHPNFGAGIGNPNGALRTWGSGYHTTGQALDVNWYPAEQERAKLDVLYRMLKPMNPTELYWQNYPGHYDHLHVAFADAVSGMLGAGASVADLPKPPEFPAGLVGDVGAAAAKYAYQAAKKFADSSMPRAGNEVYSGGGGPLKSMAQAMLAGRGWAGHWPSFNELVTRESSWNPNAQNPTSTAFGLGQFLDSTWATVGGHKTSNPKLQLDYMLRYIDQRHGNPAGAVAFHDRNNWYSSGGMVSADQGAVIPPGVTLVNNGTGRGEPVTPVPLLRDIVRQELGRVGGDTYNVYGVELGDLDAAFDRRDRRRALRASGRV